MKISTVKQTSGLSADTLRYYERIGICSPSQSERKQDQGF